MKRVLKLSEQVASLLKKNKIPEPEASENTEFIDLNKSLEKMLLKKLTLSNKKIADVLN